MKWCPSCQKTLSLSDFNHDRRRKNGYACICRACASVQFRRWYKKSAPRILAKKKAQRKENPARFRAARKRTYWKNHDKELAAMKKWRTENPDLMREISRESRQKNAEKVKAVIKQWRKDNREKTREDAKKHRALRNHAPISDLTANQWQAIKELYRYRCVYCGKKTAALTQDHIVPLSKGGSHTMENIVPACRSCNSRKKDGAPVCPVQPLLKIVD